MELMRGPSVVRLAELLVGQLVEDKPAAPAPTETLEPQGDDVKKLVAQVDELSDKEVDSLLEEIASGDRVVNP